MKNKYLYFFPILLALFGMLFLNGCAALSFAEIFAVEEVAAFGVGEAVILRGAGLEAAAATSRIIVTDELLLNSRLANARIVSRPSGKIIRFTSEQGLKHDVAEVVNNKTIRVFKNNKRVNLPGRLYTVKKRNVHLRSGPGKNYKSITTISQKQIVIVKSISSDNKWANVIVGENIEGYVFLSNIVDVDNNDKIEEYKPNRNISYSQPSSSHNSARRTNTQSTNSFSASSIYGYLAVFFLFMLIFRAAAR